MDRAALASRLDSRWNSSLRGECRPALHANPLLVTQDCAHVPTKCFVMNVSPLLRELILHACTFCKLRQGNSIHRCIIEILLDQLEAARSIPLQLRKPTDSRGARVVELLFADPSDPRTLEQLCAQCGAGKRTIERLFIVETGMTFGHDNCACTTRCNRWPVARR